MCLTARGSVFHSPWTRDNDIYLLQTSLSSKDKLTIAWNDSVNKADGYFISHGMQCVILHRVYNILYSTAVVMLVREISHIYWSILLRIGQFQLTIQHCIVGLYLFVIEKWRFLWVPIIRQRSIIIRATRRASSRLHLPEQLISAV